jgi:hypothetical protein
VVTWLLGIGIAVAILYAISIAVERKQRPPDEPGVRTPQPAEPQVQPAPQPPVFERDRKPSGNDVLDESTGCGTTIAIAFVVIALLFGLCVLAVAP